MSICWDWESVIVENAHCKGEQPNCVHTCRLFQAEAEFTLNLTRACTQHNAGSTLNVSPGIIKPETAKHVDAEAPVFLFAIVCVSTPAPRAMCTQRSCVCALALR